MVLAEERVLTYDELALVFGVTRKSARQLVSRKRWNRSKGLDGRARIHVPATALDETRPPEDATATPSAVMVLTRRVQRLEQELATAITQRDEARARSTDLAIRAAQGDAWREIVEQQRRTANDVAKRGFWARLRPSFR